MGSEICKTTFREDGGGRDRGNVLEGCERGVCEGFAVVVGVWGRRDAGFGRELRRAREGGVEQGEGNLEVENTATW